MDVVIPALYDDSLRDQAVAELRVMFERGEVRPALYWGYMAGMGQIDAYMNAAFEMFDRNEYNPVYLWLNAPGNPEMRAHPRYIELLDYIGIAAYWDQVGWPPFCTLSGTERRCDGELKVN